jgi:hypothetical protein
MFQLDEDDMGVGVADILAMVFLGVEPPGLPSLQFHLHLPAVRDEAAAKGTEGVHDAVGVCMRCGPVPRLIGVLQHPHPVVLEHDRVVVGIGDNRVHTLQHTPTARPFDRWSAEWVHRTHARPAAAGRLCP